jgi:hypothetical protein
MAERRGEMREGLTMVAAEAWGDQQSEREREREKQSSGARLERLKEGLRAGGSLP